jgi:tetratricopeptide (TPR) repeat protein
MRLEAFGSSLGESEVALWIDVEKVEGQLTRVRLSVSAFGPDGLALVQGHRVEGSSQTGLADAAALAAAALLDEMTPSEVTRFVALDEDDSAQIPILEVALDGNIARAREDLKVYVEHAPTNAAAVYNLAVLTEAMGKLRDALALYDRALQLDPKALYSEARDAAARHADLELEGQSVRPRMAN